MRILSRIKNTFLGRLTKKQLIVAGALFMVFLVVAIMVILGKNGNGHERFVVERRDLVDEVNVSGRVEAGSVADLGFEVTGSVNSVSKFVGERVFKGQALASLSLGTLLAERAQAEADVAIKKAELQTTKNELSEVIAQQDTLVANALRTLYSEGLEAETVYETTTVTAPTILGLYEGSPGQYRIRIDAGVAGGEPILSMTGLEKVLSVRVNDNRPTMLGTRGLFVSFPEDIGDYKNTSWYVNIPNTESGVYVENLNAYNNAIQTRTLEIQRAEANLDSISSGRSVVEAQLDRAQAEVARIEAEIERRTIRAPFGGVVGRMDVRQGDIVSANTIIASVISEGDFGIEIDLPEIDSVKVKTGDPVLVTLDAFGDGAVFEATVVSVNRTETVVDNVVVYEARLIFNEHDDRIASGMTADVTITTDTREGVLAIPVRALQFNENGEPSVLVDREGEAVEAVVLLGLRGSDGFIEIQSGLSNGDVVLIQRI